MSMKNHSGFGGQWDAGEFLIEELITYPISHMIKETAERAGVDMENPVRSISSIIASGFMSAFVGSFLGPFGSIWGALMGETLAIAADYPGDRTRAERERERKARLALKVKAMVTALEITKEHLNSSTWGAIVNDYQRQVDALGDRKSTEGEAFRIGENIILRSVRNAGSDVYWNFDKVYRAAKRELKV
jgi:hypothetical protein